MWNLLVVASKYFHITKFLWHFFFTKTILAREKYGTQNGTFKTSKEKVCNLLYRFSIWLLLFLNLKVLGIGHNPGNIIKTVNFKYNSPTTQTIIW